MSIFHLKDEAKYRSWVVPLHIQCSSYEGCKSCHFCVFQKIAQVYKIRVEWEICTQRIVLCFSHLKFIPTFFLLVMNTQMASCKTFCNAFFLNASQKIHEEFCYISEVELEVKTRHGWNCPYVAPEWHFRASWPHENLGAHLQYL